MKFVFHTNSVSPHQLPLSREIVKVLGADEYRYVYTQPRTDERRRLGWGNEASEWVVCEKDDAEKSHEWMDGCDVLMSTLRDIDVFERRIERGLNTIYASERWFKPRMGILRLLNPSYLKMARRFVKLLSGCGTMYYFPMGVHAARDMARLCGLLHGDMCCIFRAPQLDFERRPGGKIWLKNGKNGKKYGLDKMRMWGYYVEPTKFALQVQQTTKPIPHEVKVLWVGRLLNLKRVDTIVRAVGEHANLKRVDDSLPKITLDIYGTGPEEARLKKQASEYGDVIKFYPPVPIEQVRKLMREHDVYVLASNAYEGWGAVVNEALEEGMKMIGTCEAGASATTLPNTNLFHAGDWRGLQRLLSNDVISCGIGSWTAKAAARALLNDNGTLMI